MTHEERLNFLTTVVPSALEKLNPETSAKWGIMTAQHMVEHMILVFKLANGKLKDTNTFTEEEKIPLMKRFILSDRPFKENTKSPLLTNELLALKFDTIAAAKLVFLQELSNVFNVFEADTSLLIPNSIFGVLNYEEQVALLTKHIQHHFNQFGLLN
jgi:hypothetical protein